MTKEKIGKFYCHIPELDQWIIDEAKKEFPIPFAVLRFKTSKGLGLGNVNTFELRKWFEKYFLDDPSWGE